MASAPDRTHMVASLFEQFRFPSSMMFSARAVLLQLVDGLGGSKLAMPVEIVQFCWKYNLQRLENLPEVKGCKVAYRLTLEILAYLVAAGTSRRPLLQPLRAGRSKFWRRHTTSSLLTLHGFGPGEANVDTIDSSL